MGMISAGTKPILITRLRYTLESIIGLNRTFWVTLFLSTLCHNSMQAGALENIVDGSEGEFLNDIEVIFPDSSQLEELETRPEDEPDVERGVSVCKRLKNSPETSEVAKLAVKIALDRKIIASPSDLEMSTDLIIQDCHEFYIF